MALYEPIKIPDQSGNRNPRLSLECNELNNRMFYLIHRVDPATWSSGQIYLSDDLKIYSVRRNRSGGHDFQLLDPQPEPPVPIPQTDPWEGCRHLAAPPRGYDADHVWPPKFVSLEFYAFNRRYHKEAASSPQEVLDGIIEWFGSPWGVTIAAIQIRPYLWEEHYLGREALDTLGEPPVWHQERWWQNWLRENRWRFVTRSRKEPDKLAFVSSREKGQRLIRTRQRPGRFLTYFFKGTLTEKQIAFFTEWQNSGICPERGMPELPIKYARTADEIQDVYVRGPHSCMAYPPSKFAHFVEGHKGIYHPVRSYANGELAVAYLEEDGLVIARALVHEGRKAVGRVYPTPDFWEKDGYQSPTESESVQRGFLGRLLREGFRSIRDDPHIFNGIRVNPPTMRTDSVSRTHRRLIGPYLDNNLAYYFDRNREICIGSRGAVVAVNADQYGVIPICHIMTSEEIEKWREVPEPTTPARGTGTVRPPEERVLPSSTVAEIAEIRRHLEAARQPAAETLPARPTGYTVWQPVSAAQAMDAIIAQIETHAGRGDTQGWTRTTTMVVGPPMLDDDEIELVSDELVPDDEDPDRRREDANQDSEDHDQFLDDEHNALLDL